MDVFLTTLMPGSIDTDIEMHQEWLMVTEAQSNPEAFAPLYERYVLRIYRYIHIRVRSDEDAADITQQIFLAALQALPRYRQQGVPFAAWLFRIAQLTLKQKQRQEKGSVSWDILPADLHLVETSGPESHLIEQERLQRLIMLVSRLDNYHRDLLALHFSAGLSSTEIATIFGKKRETVKKQLTRLIQKLKEQYHDAE
jgi:RNA polymerase sigma-70 factor (ECF subfamily)